MGLDRLQSVRTAYAAFEHLVRTHAGDRATFNSMVSAANGVDDGWHATDLQHRRNAFRAMSHAVGVQAKTRLMLMIVNETKGRATYDSAILGGFIGLRILRDLPTVRVMGITTHPDQRLRMQLQHLVGRSGSPASAGDTCWKIFHRHRCRLCESLRAFSTMGVYRQFRWNGRWSEMSGRVI